MAAGLPISNHEQQLMADFEESQKKPKLWQRFVEDIFAI